MMDSASFSLIPSRELQTWQIKWPLRLINLMRCSSQKPISRSRSDISADATSSVMETVVPARMWLKGQASC